MSSVNETFALNRKDGKSVLSLIALVVGGLCILPFFGFFFSVPSCIYSGILTATYYFTGNEASFKTSRAGLLLSLVGFVIVGYALFSGGF